MKDKRLLWTVYFMIFIASTGLIEAYSSMNATYINAGDTDTSFNVTMTIFFDAFSSDGTWINFTNLYIGGENSSLVVNVSWNGGESYVFSQINVLFKSEETLSTLEGTNISLDVISDIYATNLTTNTSRLSFNVITPATYGLRYYATDYWERFYWFQYSSGTETNITLYLVSNDTATEVTGVVYDYANNLLEDAYIKVLRYDLASNSYILREISKTNFDGETNMHIILNDEFYKFIIEYPLDTVKLETSPTYIYETTLNFQILLDDSIAAKFFSSQGIDYYVTFNDATNSFRFTFSDSENDISQGCLKVVKTGFMGQTTINDTCISSTAASIIISVDNSSGTSYEAQASVYYDDEEYQLDALSHSFDQTSSAGNFGLFMIAIIMLLFAVMGLWSKTISLIITPIPLVFGSLLNIIDVSMVISVSIWITSIVIAVYISSKK